METKIINDVWYLDNNDKTNKKWLTDASGILEVSNDNLIFKSKLKNIQIAKKYIKSISQVEVKSNSTQILNVIGLSGILIAIPFLFLLFTNFLIALCYLVFGFLIFLVTLPFAIKTNWVKIEFDNNGTQDSLLISDGSMFGLAMRLGGNEKLIKKINS